MSAVEKTSVQGVEIRGKLGSRADEILNDRSLAFLAGLHRKFDATRQRLLALRNERQGRLDAGALPDFLPETAHVRSGDWKVAPIPADLLDRRVEITGPTDRKMVINALNSGAKVFMADFEDATAPTWDNLIEGQINLKDRWANRIDFTEPSTGLRMRMRMDAYHPEVSIDLKTTRFAHARAFMRDAVEKDYDLQSYMYSLGRCLYEGSTTPKPFVFVAAENSAPYSVSTYEAGPTFMGNGANKFQACAATFKACTESGYWPDLSGDSVLEIEPWQQFSGKPAWQSALASGA